MSVEAEVYKPTNHIRVVTATSLFDGHDAAINIMRRILQDTGVEVIHLGHNRSVQEIVDAAIEEDVQGIAVSSYQGGHIEFFKYLVDLLRERDASHIKIFGGGGGVIVPEEIKVLEAYGVTKIYSPEDGAELGLQGMINHMVRCMDFSTLKEGEIPLEDLSPQSKLAVAKLITAAEQAKASEDGHLAALRTELDRQQQEPVWQADIEGVACGLAIVDHDPGQRARVHARGRSERIRLGKRVLGDDDLAVHRLLDIDFDPLRPGVDRRPDQFLFVLEFFHGTPPRGRCPPIPARPAIASGNRVRRSRRRTRPARRIFP